MSELTVKKVEEILSQVKYPGFSRDIISLGVVNKIEIAADHIQIFLKFTTQNVEIKEQIQADIKQAINAAFKNVQLAIIDVNPAGGDQQNERPGGDPWAGRAPIPGIKNIIAVASGKGGVGKSTVSTNLAIALSQLNYRIGLMDSDIYGPSIHIMMGVSDRPLVNEEQKILPLEKFGIKLMSMGFLVDRDAPLIWRGPLVMKAVEQFLREVLWGELDALVIDLPPGTGDAQLTLVQKTPLTGAIIVTTPQEVALVDARRGLKMFQKVDTKVLGIVENMSYFLCPDCGKKHYIFGNDGGVRSASELKVPLLGQIPIEPIVTESGDAGVPVVVQYPQSASAKAFREVASHISGDPMFSKIP
jgi:ATP-binding protein involved in chromosome partitioning